MVESEKDLHHTPKIIGRIQAIFYQNPTNFYKVMLIEVEESEPSIDELEMVVTGNFGDMMEGESYQFSGQFVTHPKYGRQFQVERYEQVKPTSANGLIDYLSGDNFPGIGKKTAEKLVDYFGEETIDVIMNDSERLDALDFLNEKRRDTIISGVKSNYGSEKILIQLNEWGFGSQLAMTIFQKYQEQTLTLLEENPYRLIEDIEGIAFKKADNLAEHLNIAANSPERFQAAILTELLSYSLSEGHTYIEAQVLLEKVVTLLESSRRYPVELSDVADQIIALIDLGKMQQEGTKLFHNSLFYAEWGVSHAIHRLLKRKQSIDYDEATILASIKQMETELGIAYGPSQKTALIEGVQSSFFILTGGPGTGKTTVINGLVRLFSELNELSLDINDYHNEVFPILLAAPTGRAAKRMSETTGLPAKTIHRLLGLTGQEMHPEEIANELEGSLLILDEMSMVDTWLANALFKAIPTNMQVIIVGDKDQLPSVGPGQVLHDLLSIPMLPQCELTDIYRQEDGSSIIALAHAIKEGTLPTDFTRNQKDRSFIAGNTYQIEEMIRQIVVKAAEKGFTASDIQVLAPMYRGPAGIDRLNKMLQEVLNPNESGRRKEVTWFETVYRIGDKVLQLVNVPENQVYNGDIGEITGIILAKEHEDKVDVLVVDFDGIEVEYPRNQWQQLTLAYCCSIHKSQGSEYPLVILPMVNGYYRMLQRNLLYTAITRSQERLILLGELEAYETAVKHEGANRQTALKERIMAEAFPSTTSLDTQSQEESIPKEEIAQEQLETPASFILTKELILSGAVDPMIGMEGITPFDYI